MTWSMHLASIDLHSSGVELTKLHEQCVLATLGELGCADQPCTSTSTKGEFVIVVGGSQESTQSSLDVDELLLELVAEMPARRGGGDRCAGNGKQAQCAVSTHPDTRAKVASRQIQRRTRDAQSSYSRNVAHGCCQTDGNQ